ncbi:MAG: hypothetical protein O2973_12880 [Gemmatimonadetes bacterium]|nr:hypothetical protein [Gemmatimonadota bacterium]
MKPAEWVATRTPPAPDELRAHMHGFVKNGDDAAEYSGPLISACEEAFARVLDSGAASRESAFDLLSADAFVTYAFEAAADEPATIAERADAAMRCVSDLAAARFTTEAQ